jgi:hypothetical protein
MTLSTVPVLMWSALITRPTVGASEEPLAAWPAIHYNSYSHFRRPEAAENKPVPAENKLFSAAKPLFSAASGRQKKLTENKALLSAARAWPPKIAYFRRLASWPPKVSYFRRPGSQPPKIKNCRK